jgi:predicted ATPase/class 3 adenylate cyclase
MSMVRSVVGGVDTHADTHVAAAVDQNGGLLGIESFPASETGYEELLGWLVGFGDVEQVGVEGTGSWGVGLTRFLGDQEVVVIEVDRPNRQKRRKQGKSDPTDAVAAARAALSGEATVTPKARNGPVEQIRVLMVARRSAREQRIQSLNQLRHLVFTAPEEIRLRYKDRYKTGLITEAANMRPNRGSDPVIFTTYLVIRNLTRRIRRLNAEMRDIDRMLAPLITETAPKLFELYGVGVDTAPSLLVTAGDNPERLHSEPSWAHLCGVAPLPANSGKMTNRFRLNRGGDRQANAALYRIVLTDQDADLARGTLARMLTQPTGTITFLFTDIVGSTRLWEEQPGLMESTVARHDELLRTTIESYDGYVFTTAGDGFAAAFSDPLDAVTAALTTQQSLGSESWGVGELVVRMGLNTGVAQEREGDYFGPAVNRTARIADAGHGGQVLVSQTTRDLAVDRLPDEVGLRSLGEHRLKDLGSPEMLHQVVHGDLRFEFPPLRTLNVHKNNLPVEMTSFIGRHDELEETMAHMRSSRLVTLIGVGGSGKTRLALHTAAEMFDGFPDGVWMVELAPVVDGTEISQRVAKTLGLEWLSPQESSAPDRRTAMDAISEFLGDRTALLVLDNCEHLIGAAAEFTDRLLQSCRGVRVLATSREGLGVRGENLIQVPSLELSSMFGLNDEGRYPDAMELFAERAAAVSHFELNDETAPTVADICSRLDGMPLAIELAAARTRVLNVDQILERLTDTFRLLTGGARTALPRQQTLLATVDWSYQLLDDRERIVFARLAVFRGGFFLEAAEAIVSGEGVDEVEVFDVVASLVDKSMVQARAESGRFGLLETLRQFALQRFTDAGEGDRWRERHAAYYADVAEEAHSGTRSRDQVAWFERLDRDHENLKAALTWAMEHARFENAARIANGLWWFWQARGHIDTGLTHIRALLARDDLPVALRTGLLTGAAVLEFEGGDISASLPAGQEAVELARTLDDPSVLSLALIYWANTASNNFGMWDEAHAGYDEGYALGEQVGSDWLMGWHALNKGWIHRLEAELGESERWLLVARDHFQRAEIPMGLGWALSGLGASRRWAGDNEGSLDLFKAALETHAIKAVAER